jgi:hypothetical protein
VEEYLEDVDLDAAVYLDRRGNSLSVVEPYAERPLNIEEHRQLILDDVPVGLVAYGKARAERLTIVPLQEQLNKGILADRSFRV